MYSRNLTEANWYQLIFVSRMMIDITLASPAIHLNPHPPTLEKTHLVASLKNNREGDWMYNSKEGANFKIM